MMLQTRRPRTGFTLIEMLVVMLIIAVLVGLLLPAVMRATDAGKRTQASAEMNELGMAIGQFKSKYSVDYVPSKIMLFDDFPTTTPRRHEHSASTSTRPIFLKTCWPNIGGPVELLRTTGTERAHRQRGDARRRPVPRVLPRRDQRQRTTDRLLDQPGEPGLATGGNAARRAVHPVPGGAVVASYHESEI